MCSAAAPLMSVQAAGAGAVCDPFGNSLRPVCVACVDCNLCRAALLASGWLLKMGGNRKFTIKHWQVGTAVFPAARHVCPARWSWSVWRARRVLRLRV